MAGTAKKTAKGRKSAASDERVGAAVKTAKSGTAVRRGNDLTVDAAVKTAKSAVSVRRGNELTVGAAVKTAKSEANVAKSKVSSVPPIVEEVLGAGTFSVEKFVECFDVLVEAAGGTAQLRELTGTMAFTGQLVSPLATDSSVDATLARIEAAWSRLKRKEVLAPVETDETPASPARWAWVRLGNLAEVVGGVTKGRDLKGRKRLSVPYLRVANVQRGFLALDEMKEIEIAEEELPKYRLERGDVLFTEGGDWDKLGRSTIWQAEIEPCIHQNHVFRARLVSSQLDPAWFSAFANSPVGRRYFENAAKRTTNLASINMTQLRNCPMPLPPLAEQKRIVARVDQLMALIGELEAKQTRKRELGARFTQASLEALTTAEGPEEFDAAWKRVVENWETVIDRAEKVAAVRRAVLELAFRGLVVEHESTRNALVEIRRKKPKVEALNRSDEPFAIPRHWVWLRLSDVLSCLTDGDHQAPPQVPTGVPFLTIGNVSAGRVDFRDTRYVSRGYFESLDPRRVPSQGDILYTVVGASYGRPVLVDEARQFCVQRHIAILRPDGTCERPFLYLFLRSSIAYVQATQAITGTAQPTVPLRPLRDFKMPLPPLAEQTHIIAKVGQLMKFCDDLESWFTRSEKLSSKLVESLVREMVD